MTTMLIRSALSALSPAGANGRLSILIFHRVVTDPDPLFPGEVDRRRFDELMGWVRDWFNVLPLDEGIQRLRLGCLPARAAAITFDDGYADNLLNAVPILQKYGLSATFFIANGFLDGGRMWNDTVIEAIRGAMVEWIDPGVAELSAGWIRSDDEKRALLSRWIPAIKHLPHLVRDETVARIADASRAHLPCDLMLTSPQVRALRSTGMLIGGHTVSHPILLAANDVDAEREIADGKQALENLLGEPVRFFAYPNGKPEQDYASRHVDMVKKLGFEAALSTSWGANTLKSDLLQLRRFTPWDRRRWAFGLRMVANLRRRD